MHYDKFHGLIKDVKFYYDTVTTEENRLCNTDSLCSECN